MFTCLSGLWVFYTYYLDWPRVFCQGCTIACKPFERTFYDKLFIESRGQVAPTAISAAVFALCLSRMADRYRTRGPIVSVRVHASFTWNQHQLEDCVSIAPGNNWTFPDGVSS